jgi:hypothetical protein
MRLHRAGPQRKNFLVHHSWGIDATQLSRVDFFHRSPSQKHQPTITFGHQRFSAGREPRRSAVKDADNWKVYRTRYLVRARQLTAPLSIVDGSGKEQSGHEGDYLVECSDGSHRIAPRQIFEDIYVEIGAPVEARMFSLIRGLRRTHVVTADDTSQPVLFSLTG